MMRSDRSLPEEGELTTCTWCGARLGQNVMPLQSAKVFCSRGCEIEGNFWLFQEFCSIEFTEPCEGECDSP
ncbi:MAG: hypothetical protein ABSD13_01820 [Candidatus Korobacteraceae bacterium]|jgi:hypothetical protein